MIADINGSALFYIESGSTGNNPSVIFIHGFPFSHEMWTEQLHLVGKTHHAIAYDVRGHGKTDRGDGQYTIESHVDDLLALMKHLNIKKTVLVGFSMGGYIALRAVERNPESFAGLVLCNTKSEADTDEAKIKRFQSMKDIKINGVTDIFTTNYLKNVFTPQSLETNLSSVHLIRQTIKSTNPFLIASNFLALAARTDTTESLKKIGIPTLILVGEKDVITTPKNAKSMHDQIKNSEMAVIPNAAHMSNLENPSVFNEKLLNFLVKHQNN